MPYKYAGCTPELVVAFLTEPCRKHASACRERVHEPTDDPG
jgi:hypothetical protein